MYQTELKLAIKAARAAGEILSCRKGIEINSAQGKDIKLTSDKESEQEILRILQANSAYPLLSEECGLLPGESKEDLMWIVDPLDGTANYFKGMGELTCISIALWKKSTPVLGVVYRYEEDELYWGVVGEGAFCNQKSLQPSKVGQVEDAVIATGFPLHRDYGTQSLLSFVKDIQQFKKVRMLGAAAIMGTFVAAGKVDVYWEDHIMLWDIAAAAAIVSAAGGEVEIEILSENMCVCRFYANRKLMEDLHAKGI